MKYPDGTIVKLGDRVWCNNEDAVGVVVDIWETAEQWKAMGDDEPGMAVCMDGSNSDLSGCSFVAYPERCLKDDGIRLLTAPEGAEVDRVLEAARAFLPETSTKATSSVYRNRRSGVERWNVVFYLNLKPVEIVEVEPSSYTCKKLTFSESGLFPERRF